MSYDRAHPGRNNMNGRLPTFKVFNISIMRFYAILPVLLLGLCGLCNAQAVKNQPTLYPAPVDAQLWTNYSPQQTTFFLWAPTAREVVLRLYKKGAGGEVYKTDTMKPAGRGIWQVTLKGDLDGVFYTYQVRDETGWLAETPGIYAAAVGVNGQRAMVLDMKRTNPSGWAEDKGPRIDKPNDAIIYELHIRDMTIHPGSGSSYPGKYLGLAETGTRGPGAQATGLDHLRELGITHVHLLPAFDYRSVDETRLDEPQFNWGYDPLNYNVPEGSYATDPYDGAVRIREFKEMVKALHDNGIGVILDVVYNHTGHTEESNFNQEAPGYYYRHWTDGAYANASACGNETASERPMMRKFMTESIIHWVKEYHIDGFRFDLMGIHDTATMNHILREVRKVDPDVFIYGEGWTAGDSPLPVGQRALKAHMQDMPGISAFSDDIRDGLKGSVFDEMDKGFVSGAKGKEASVKFGVAGAIAHDQVDYTAVNYSKAPWTNDPWQAVSYVSCHDNHTLYDKLRISCPDASEAEIIAMHKLANAVVLTSQGMAFLHAGVDMLRTKQGEHNSYNLPDSINQIDWQRKAEYREVFDYYRKLIALRKNHPAFRMPTGDLVRKHVQFIDTPEGLVAFRISDHANGDRWKEIVVVYNAGTTGAYLPVKGEWKLAALGGDIDENGIGRMKDILAVPARSMLVAFRE